MNRESFFGPIKKVPYSPRISVYDNESDKSVNLGRKDCIKYLGVLIDQNLSCHICHQDK